MMQYLKNLTFLVTVFISTVREEGKDLQPFLKALFSNMTQIGNKNSFNFPNSMLTI